MTDDASQNVYTALLGSYWGYVVTNRPAWALASYRTQLCHGSRARPNLRLHPTACG